jgi:hypothetical protein
MVMSKRIALQYVGENGDHAEAIPSFFKPLTFSDLFPENKLYEINAEVKAGDAKINGDVIKDKSTLTIPINFHSDISIYVLVPDGWLPITFLNNEWLIPDRNFISSIIQIRSNVPQSNIKSAEWWLDFHKNSDLTINPLLYALEGNKKRKPTYNEFRSSFEKAVQELKSYFPQSKIISSNDERFYKAGYALLEEMTFRQRDEINFLIETAPLVATPHSDRQVVNIQDQIDKIATKYNLLGKTFLYYLVISCLYERNDKKYFKASRKVLKPSLNYDEVDAYNTIADINALNMFIQLWSILKRPYPICTCDKGLVAFWCGLNPIEISSKNKKIDIEFKVSEYLFPRLSLEQRQNLADKIKGKRSITC